MGDQPEAAVYFASERPPEGATLGRGAGADVVIQDASISSLHAALEPCSSGFRLRDLGSTNGVRLNGSKVLTADLKHGDRFELGEPLSKAARQHLEAAARFAARLLAVPDAESWDAMAGACARARRRA